MAHLPAFATKEQLAVYWRVLTAEEQTRADVLLVLASNRLRLIGSDVGIDLDTKKDGDEAYETTLRWVVMESVKRALATPTDQPPVDSWAQTAGPYSENYKYTNPSGDLWFKKSELSSLGLVGRQSLDSLNTSQNAFYDIYSS